jgi:hypothetical protein
MSAPDEIISKFLDDQPFDIEGLADALNDPAGRALLIDLITLRRLVQPIDAVPAMKAPTPIRRFGWHVAAAAAALVVGLASGYVVGDRRSTETGPDAPPPTRVVQAVPFVPDGGSR